MIPRLHPTPPQLAGGLFLYDSAMKSTLVFHAGRDLPAFVAFPASSRTRRTAPGSAAGTTLAIAERCGNGFVINTLT